MFGDDNQNQPTQDNNSTDGQVGDQANPPASDVSSFNMDGPHQDGPAVSIPSSQPSSAPMPGDEAKTDETPITGGDSAGGVDNGLLDIKQQALTQLSPMLGHLDQTPEEKFRTTMMMIQANDDKSLIKDAYGAAQEITDEKAKAQALLDIVNEINYFTHGSD